MSNEGEENSRQKTNVCFSSFTGTISLPPSLSLCLSLSLSLFLSLSCLSYIIYVAHTFYLSISFRLQPEVLEHKKLLSLKETPSLKDNKGSSRERSPSAIPSIHIEDSTDGNEDGQFDHDREASPSTIPDSELPAGPNGVDDGAIRGNESTTYPVYTHYEMLISSNLQSRLFTTCTISTSN